MLLEDTRIVYIEDDLRNRKLVELTLQAEGAKVWFERWGIPAMAVTTVIGYSPVHLILLDLMFPNGFSGYDVFTELRTRHELDNVPIVMISAADASIEMPKARDLGLSGYIPKPIDSEIFPEQIKTIMDGTPIWQTTISS